MKKLAAPVGQRESEHVDALSKTITDLGGTPVASPTFHAVLDAVKPFIAA